MGTVTYDFHGQVALVTGAARGLGRDIAISFARAGASLLLVDIARDSPLLDYSLARPEDLEATAHHCRQAGAEALTFIADVRSEAEVVEMVRECVAKLGRLDILVNNAGVFAPPARVTDVTEEQWDAVVDVDMKGPFFCTKHAARHMIERGGGGRIVTISSTSGLVGIPNQVQYQSAKHGLVGQVKTLALELAPHMITVNNVCPTVVASPMLDYLVRVGASYWQDVSKLCGASTIFPGLDNLEPQDVSNAVLWLSSDAARYVTGISLPVDGGFTAK